MPDRDDGIYQSSYNNNLLCLYIKFLNLNFVLFDDELVTEAEHKTRDNLAEFSQT